MVSMAGYQGSSAGYSMLEDDYANGYAVEIIRNRAIPDLRDGLKPVNRRILIAMHDHKMFGLHKSNTIVGNTIAMHPHGDDAIYEAMVRMVDSNEALNVPLIRGDGSFGRVYSSTSAAAPRYTMAGMGEHSRLFFRDVQGATMVEAETDEGMEFDVLPVPYPHILVANNSGLAVSTSSRTPSFNFWDVLDITEKYLKQGHLGVEDILVPDFPTGGHVIYDQKEFYKVLVTGKGRFKVRANVEIQGKDIIVTEVPVDKTVEMIVKKIQEKMSEDKLKGIKDVINGIDNEHGCRIIIRCTSQAVTETVLMALYREGLLQTYYSANMVTINGRKPVLTGGVQEILKQWVEWRKSVIIKKNQGIVAAEEDRSRKLGFFLRLINNHEWRDRYIELLLETGGLRKGNDYLRELFEDIDGDSIKWIAERRVISFQNGGKYAADFKASQAVIEAAQLVLDDVRGQILRDLDEMRTLHKGMYARRTKITHQDYRFSKVESSVVEDTSFCRYTIFSDGFILKTRGGENVNTSKTIISSFTGQANDTIVVLNSLGNLIRVYGEDLPFTRDTEPGTHIGAYAGALESTVMAAFPLEDTKKVIVYNDGWVGFLDLSEFLGAKKRTKLIANGVSPEIGNSFGKLYDQSEVGLALAGACMTETGSMYTGYRLLQDINVKSRTARTRVFTPPKSAPVMSEVLLLNDEDDLTELFTGYNLEFFEGNLRKVALEGFAGLTTHGDRFETIA